MQNFKQMIIDCLAQPAHTIEVDYYHDLGEQGPACQYIIQIDSVDDWYMFGFINDMTVRTCRPGSGPVGPRDGPGRPHQQFTDLIQRSFYRKAVCFIYLLSLYILYF